MNQKRNFGSDCCNNFNIERLSVSFHPAFEYRRTNIFSKHFKTRLYALQFIWSFPTKLHSHFSVSERRRSQVPSVLNRATFETHLVIIFYGSCGLSRRKEIDSTKICRTKGLYFSLKPHCSCATCLRRKSNAIIEIKSFFR